MSFYFYFKMISSTSWWAIEFNSWLLKKKYIRSRVFTKVFKRTAFGIISTTRIHKLPQPIVSLPHYSKILGRRYNNQTVGVAVMKRSVWQVYNTGTGEETFTSSLGILKCHDILINHIPSQKMYWNTIELGDTIMHGTNGMMSFCNNCLGSLGVNIFVYISLKHHFVVQVGQLSS